MLDDAPSLRVSQLRGGLHALVLMLAVVVLLRASLLSEPRVGWIGAVVCIFFVLYIVGTVKAWTGIARMLWMSALIIAWLALTLLGADAAYLSLGLFLLFFTELSLTAAFSLVAAMTAVGVAIGALGSSWSSAETVGPLLGAVLAVLMGLGFRVLFQETERRQSLIEELQRTRADLAEREHTAGENAERQRLAQEIHDTVAQGLSSIQMLLHAAEAEQLPPGAADKIELARHTAAASLADARRLVGALSPADLVGSSLVEALTSVCDRTSGMTPARLVVEGEPAALPMPIEAALVRIAQGALSNVAKHADAKEAVMTLTYGSDAVHLDVVDNGRGFDATVLGDPDAHHFGLITMRQRVEQLSGRWALESEAGHTAVSVSFPLIRNGDAR